MSDAPSTVPRPFRREVEATSIEANGQASPAAIVSDLRDEEEQAFALPARLFEQVPFAIYVCDQHGLVRRYNRRAAQLWGRMPQLGDPNERFCGSYRMFRPDGSLLPHHECPMADVLRTGVSVRQQEVHIERPDGSRGIALVDIEAIKDADGNIVGAVNCFLDVTERKRHETQIVTLAREAEHRTKNILASVQATVNLSYSDTTDGLKQVIAGRIQALANVHELFVQSRWAGAELQTVVEQELSPFRGEAGPRVSFKGPSIILEPNIAQAIAISLHELATNAAKYGSLSTPGGRLDVEWSRTADDGLSLRWTETGGPTVTPPTHNGFGSLVMEKIIENQLGGEARFDWHAHGLTCQITLPRL